jgi:poly(3-hydroxybutyrate) depolymerase
MRRMPRPARLLAAFAGFAAVLLGCAVNARAACDGTTVPAGSQQLEIGGAMRHFVVRVPTGQDGRTPAPVVFAFHPFGMNAQYMQSRAPIGRAWPEAFVLYPEGLPRDASRAVPSWQTRLAELGDRDLAFFDAMLAWLELRGCVDRQRVFVLGYSNGGGLAHVLACARGQMIAGAAIAAGRLSCTPSSAMPIVLSHGVRDQTIDYGQAIQASQAWGSANGCAAPPKAGVPGCVTATGCATATTLCTHPGGHEYDPAFTKVAAEFFKAMPDAATAGNPKR